MVENEVCKSPHRRMWQFTRSTIGNMEDVSKKMDDLSELQKETYNYIKEVGDIQTPNIPDKRMWGAIPNLVDRGLVKVFKKYTSYFKKRKKKFVKVTTNKDDVQPC